MDASIPAPAAFIMDFIGTLEAPKGYDTVYNNRMKSMPKKLTSMTFDEVVAQGKWRTDNFGSSACGRYQFMRNTLDAPKTTADLKGEMSLVGTEKFTPALQDRMCLHLLRRRGYDKFIAGTLSVAGFQNNIAKEWASFPVATAINGKRRGQSYYAGDGQNYALTTADKLESILRQALDMASRPVPAIVATPPIVSSPIAAPRATVGGALASLWAKVGPTPKVALVPSVAVRNDPTIFAVQQQLHARNYMTNGRVDGLDGPKTRDAVSAIRKDNGLNDGGIDTEFLTKLPTFGPRPVSAERTDASTAQAYAIAKEQAPDLTKPVTTLWQGGLGSMLLGGAGISQANGLLDKFNDTSDKANSILASVQSGFNTFSTIVTFALEYKWWIIGIFGIWQLLKAADFAAGLVIRIRQARGI